MRLVFLVLMAGLSAMASGFRAAAAKADITPNSPQWLMGYADRQSTGVLDHIDVRVAAMEANGTQMYLGISTYSCRNQVMFKSTPAFSPSRPASFCVGTICSYCNVANPSPSLSTTPRKPISPRRISFIHFFETCAGTSSTSDNRP